MNLQVQFQDAELRRKLKSFSTKLNKSAADSITELARIGATQLAYRIEPYGLTKKAKDTLEGAVYKDMSKTYWDTGRTYRELKKISLGLATAYAAAVNSGNDLKAEQIAAQAITGFKVASTDDGSHLQTARNNRGRVQTPRPMGITDKAQLEALKAKEALTAGTAKAGWIQAGLSIGSKTRVAKWLKKTANLGSSHVRRSGWNTIITLVNHVRYASAIMPQGKISQAVANAYKNHIKRMEKQLAALIKTV